MSKKTQSVRIFISYSHQDTAWFKRLRPLLTMRPPAQLAFVWHDQELTAGSLWDKEIQDELEMMDIFLCLVSHNFFASDYIMDKEVCRAQRRHENGEIEVVPILLENFNLRRDIPFLSEFNPMPVFGRSWSSYNPRANAHRMIRDGIMKVIDKVKVKRRTGTL